MARSCPKERAELGPLCPGSSDIDLFGDCQSIVYLYGEIAHRALDLGVAQQQLDGTQVSRMTVDKRRLRSTQ